jgi:hypothetical protein
MRRAIFLEADSKVKREMSESFEEDTWKTLDMGNSPSTVAQ